MRQRRIPIVLIGMIAAYVVLLGASSFARYDAFHATTLDLGIMAQVTWNTAYGRLFETSIGRATNTKLVGSYLGNHVRPILLLIAPLYRLWPDFLFQRIGQAVGRICADDNCFKAHLGTAQCGCRADTCFSNTTFSGVNDYAHPRISIYSYYTLPKG